LSNDSEKDTYLRVKDQKSGASRVLGLGLVSAASAIAGGLAVAWWYRKTLTKLQNPISQENLQNSELSQSEEEGLD
jgi:hypothetical protein